MRILIIKIGAIGDVLRTTCILRPLKKKYPGCKISWLSAAQARPLLVTNPLISEVYALNKKTPTLLRDKNFDQVLSLDEDAQACRIASQLKTKKLIGAYQNSDGKFTYTPESAIWFD